MSEFSSINLSAHFQKWLLLHLCKPRTELQFGSCLNVILWCFLGTKALWQCQWDHMDRAGVYGVLQNTVTLKGAVPEEGRQVCYLLPWPPGHYFSVGKFIFLLYLWSMKVCSQVSKNALDVVTPKYNDDFYEISASGLLQHQSAKWIHLLVLIAKEWHLCLSNNGGIGTWGLKELRLRNGNMSICRKELIL